PRIRATAVLLAVLASAAWVFVGSPQRPAQEAKPPVAARVDASAAGGPVKFVGAAPKSSNCAEQVWPYIEQRGLTRIADRPPAAPRTRAFDADGFPFAPAAGRGNRVSLWADEDDAWVDRADERPFFGEPRRPMGRRAHRHGRFRGYGGLFGFRF